MLFGRDATKRPTELSEVRRSSLADAIDDTKQYQTLGDRATEDTSNLRGRSIMIYIFSGVCNLNKHSKHMNVLTEIQSLFTCKHV